MLGALGTSQDTLSPSGGIGMGTEEFDSLLSTLISLLILHQAAE